MLVFLLMFRVCLRLASIYGLEVWEGPMAVDTHVLHL